MRLHFHLRRHAKEGNVEINRESWFRLKYEAHDAARTANSTRSNEDLFFDVIECTSDGCERRRSPRKPSEGFWYST